jgi:chromosome segregation ATPase
MALRESAPIAKEWLEVTMRLRELKANRDKLRAEEAELTAKINAAQAEQDRLDAQYQLVK